MLWRFRPRIKGVFEAALGELPELPSRIPVTYKYGAYNDIAQLSAVEHDYDNAAKLYASYRLSQGDQVVLGEYQRSVIFYGWLTFGRMELGVGQFVRIAPTSVFTYKLYTVKSQRGNRVLAGFYADLKPRLLLEGYKRILCTVNLQNKPSIIAHQKLGFQFIGKVLETRFFTYQRFHMSADLRSRLLE